MFNYFLNFFKMKYVFPLQYMVHCAGERVELACLGSDNQERVG